MNGETFFSNRTEAGKKLAELLEKYRGQDAVVLALPRGGVVPAKIIAKSLGLPLGIVVVRKIGHPMNPEYGIAAISENTKTVRNESEVVKVDPGWFKEETSRQLKEAGRRREKYWGKREPIDLKDKIAIIVDDGLATGLTMMAAIEDVKAQNPKKIIVAVPVSPKNTAEAIKARVDEFIAAIIPEPFLGAVGSYYEDFPQVSDGEVIELLKDPGQKLLFKMSGYHDLAIKMYEDLKNLNFATSDYQCLHFANDEFQISLDQKVMGDDCFYIGTVEPPPDLAFEYFLTCHTFHKEGAGKIIAVLPYLAYMRQDKNEPLKSLAADFIIKSMEAYRVSEIVTIDIHSSYVEINSKIGIISLSPAWLFADYLKTTIEDFTKYSVVAPDKGAVNRAEELRVALGVTKDLIYFLKKREGERMESRMVGADPGGRAIIVDDILDTGETLIKCAEALKEKGVMEMIVVVTHGLFTGEMWQKLFDLNVKKIIVTDSALKSRGRSSERIEVLSVAPILVNHFMTYE